jgi:molybdate transport system ATP-binding protein
MTMLVARFAKRFPSETIHADLTFRTDRFSIVVLYGPSGCGKTTVLRCLAGLEYPEQGHIHFGDQTWTDAETRVCWTPQQRDVGFLFQEYALFPHLNVEQNIGYGLSHQPPKVRRQLTGELMERLALNGLAQRFPQQISGGQKQRVALARVLVRRPKLLLLDEPLSALDVQIREQVRLELRRLLVDFGIPVVLVTHDRTEALTLADQMIVMEQGRPLQMDVPDVVYRRPSSVGVARIMGVETIEPANIIERKPDAIVLMVGSAHLTAAADPAILGSQAVVCIRAEDVQLSAKIGDPQAKTANLNTLEGPVRSVTPEGPLVRVSVDCGFCLTSLMTRPIWEQLKLVIGDTAIAAIAESAVVVVGCQRGTSGVVVLRHRARH